MSAKPAKPKILFGAAASDGAVAFEQASREGRFSSLSTASATDPPISTPCDPSDTPSWGPAARGALSLDFNPKKFSWIARVMLQIDAELLDVGVDDQSRVALGIETRLPSGYLKRQLASPWIFSLDALNTFCEYNWAEYEKLSATQTWPRTWFWESKPAKGVRPRRADSFAERGLGS
jgi:hypothetical protein